MSKIIFRNGEIYINVQKMLSEINNKRVVGKFCKPSKRYLRNFLFIDGVVYIKASPLIEYSLRNSIDIASYCKPTILKKDTPYVSDRLSQSLEASRESSIPNLKKEGVRVILDRLFSVNKALFRNHCKYLLSLFLIVNEDQIYEKLSDDNFSYDLNLFIESGGIKENKCWYYIYKNFLFSHEIYNVMTLKEKLSLNEYIISISNMIPDTHNRLRFLSEVTKITLNA